MPCEHGRCNEEIETRPETRRKMRIRTIAMMTWQLADSGRARNFQDRRRVLKLGPYQYKIHLESAGLARWQWLPR